MHAAWDSLMHGRAWGWGPHTTWVMHSHGVRVNGGSGQWSFLWVVAAAVAATTIHFTGSAKCVSGYDKWVVAAAATMV